MKLITRDTDYAIRTLCFIVECRKNIVPVSALAKKLKIPHPFLRKILQILNKEGVLKSYKGQGGGFSLAVPPDKIFLVDLIKIFQGPIKLNECIFRKRRCPDIDKCSLKKKIDVIEGNVIAGLESITVASLCDDFRKTGRFSK